MSFADELEKNWPGDDESRPFKVFVYGTLKQGFGNHGALANHDAVKLAEGITAETAFSMECMGSFPGVYLGGKEAIWGEVYAVSLVCLNQLDRLEGHPHFYQRQEVYIKSADGDALRAWMYVLPANSPMRHRPGQKVKERIEVLDIDGTIIANWLGHDWDRWPGK